MWIFSQKLNKILEIEKEKPQGNIYFPAATYSVFYFA